MLKVSIVLLAMMVGTCVAQDKEQGGLKHDRLDFVVKEVDGSKVVNSRAYSTIVETAPFYVDARNGTSIRAESRVRYTVMPNNWQTANVGVSIDTLDAREVPTGLALYVRAEVNDIAPTLDSGGTASTSPLTRQTKWSSDVVVPIRKPTTIFSSDDPTSKHKMQLELTATPIP